MSSIGPHVIIPKGPDNPYGSVTGPYNTEGGWGLPAGPEHKCPKCGGDNFKYYSGFMIAAENKCSDCDYIEVFCY